MNLANKYRPKSWAEVVGQQATISILSRQIALKKFKQAYLFVGKAGCGKTSVARIFCNDLNGSDSDIIEIDAASNNGVDNIRALIADAQQSPIACEFKTYVIDECHQLTRAAWDAALKLIEEPPTSAIFIFCTTSPNKIPETILSRVQRFDFRSVDYKTIADRLEFICNEELYKDFDREALERIAIKADGCVRAAVQMLDQCMDSGSKVTIELVETILGLAKYSYLSDILYSLVSGDSSNCIRMLNSLENTNNNMLDIFEQFVGFVLELAIYLNTNNSNYCKLPNDVISDIAKHNLDKHKVSLILDRLIAFRTCVVSNVDAAILLKTLAIELGDNA